MAAERMDVLIHDRMFHPEFFECLLFHLLIQFNSRLFWCGSIGQVGEFAKQLGSHALVVTDAGVLSAGHPQKIIASLQSAGLKTYLFDGMIENPTDLVFACVHGKGTPGDRSIVGVGGGSSLDTARYESRLTNGGRCRTIGVSEKQSIHCFP